MEALDPLLLSRMQFAFVVSFHALFPVFTIGLAAYIAVLEALWYRTDSPVYRRLSEFWIKIFAVVFGMGVVSGVVMSFQFGTNWSEFSFATANFLGPILSYEVLTAFFLEAVFLGILLFGRDRVPRGTHLFAACMVAIGTFISSFWILSANSWMHTPQGFEFRDGIVHVTSWIEAIFNPSLWYRFGHVALASLLTGGFVVAGVSAYFLLRKRAVEMNRKALSMTLWLLLLVAPAQVFMGDLHGLNSFEHQPTKVAAMEGAWETQQGAPLYLFAIPDSTAETNHLAVGIPNLASFILTHQWDGEVPGLKEVSAEERPPVGTVFWSFRVMVGIGVLMLLVVLWGAWLRMRGRLFESRPFLRTLQLMIPLPFVAVLTGWFVTEIGRQPWLIYGQMTLAEGVTPSLTGWMALLTLVGYVVVYAVIFTAGLYYITRIVRSGPEGVGSVEEPAHAKRPFSAADIPFDDDPDFSTSSR
ncbi:MULTISPECIES: cytochrome ubiquinol oxidase subunit I [unclassified Halorhodospira]|uniref:cytochrome ubiquinol oxidase subunit I n=1 Tax=unclassified Halorhodospira TaxID=2626748 RepID=UPI001EE8EBD9|nr:MULTISPECIES: cytochrome ubiquinol oxidase subunit I [unclassified Halorhodospira]MCG5540802.1 cytochrome ubiquinol oxidase subunit I [Halorhodospira sp. M39old]MCG5546042.1 cytochrome ubiquinol oxidase subunit I [Halorhodospira sp. M38]